ncbi:uncharacterized protein LOC135484475 isoform X2 [Lineus longissimus]|uniref:uncharacterized protein LOC135484475 isoform X2 n=2 Tax=Lineus longissimus TaxID=88925 RepID=UPI00315DF30A
MTEMESKMNPDGEDVEEDREEKSDLPLRILDMFLAYVFLAPLVVAYWRGTWTVIDTYLAPDNKEISSWASTVIGISIIMTVTVLQELFKRCSMKMHFIALTVLTRVYIYVVGFGAVNLWRGVWYLWDHYTSKTAISGGVSFTVGVVLLALCRGVRNINAPPLVIVVDRNSVCFDVPTRFHASVKVVWKYVLDSLFTVVLVGSLVVFVWRGGWTLFDSLVFPGDATKPQSALVSYITGFIISLIYAIIQFPAEKLSECLSTPKRKYGKIIFEQFYWLIGFFGPLNIWRGYWYFMDLYLLPEQPIVSCWITHVVGYIGLTLLVNSTSVLVVGCLIDGAKPMGSGVTLPINLVQDIRHDGKIFANADEVECRSNFAHWLKGRTHQRQRGRRASINWSLVVFRMSYFTCYARVSGENFRSACGSASEYKLAFRVLPLCLYSSNPNYFNIIQCLVVIKIDKPCTPPLS